MSVPRPSDALGPDAWAAAHAENLDTLRSLIRIPSVNPPDPPGAELEAAHLVAALLEDAGLRPEVVEPFPGRGSVACRLRGDGSGGDPLLLLSHLDVVPAPADGWTHDPFAADIADGYVWGRGAVDMKQMVAMEVTVLRLLAAQAVAAGRDPASDPIPGLRRDVLFLSTSDEEAGGVEGIGWVVEHRPEWVRAAGALNECGAVSVEFGGRRFYPIGVAEKGYADYTITVDGTWGHGSMPRPDNAAVRAAVIAERLAVEGPARPTPVMTRFLEGVAETLGGPAGRRVRDVLSDDPAVSAAAIDALCDPMYARAIRALLRDTVSPNVIRAGVKYNVIPGVAELEVDCRTLPGTDDAAMLSELRRRIGEDLWSYCHLDPFLIGDPVEAPLDGELYPLLESTLIDHDPSGVPVPVMMPFATDAKHTVKVGTPAYGFSPLQLEPGEAFLERFHGTDERVGLDALRFGLPVLYDVVRRFCG